MLEQTLSHLQNCKKGQQEIKEQLNSSQILKSCYYSILSIPKKQHNRLESILQSQSMSQLPRIKNKQRDGSDLMKNSLLGVSQFEGGFTEKRSLLGQNICSESMLNRSYGTRPQMSSMNRLLLKLKDHEKNQKDKKNKLKENKIRMKVYPKKIKIGLTKEQRYFESNQVIVNTTTIKQMGLYQAGQLFKNKNIVQNLKQLSIVAQKHQFNPIQYNHNCDIFVTNVMPIPDFCMQTFVDEEIAKHSSNHFQLEKQSFSSHKGNLILQTSLIDQNEKIHQVKAAIFLITIKNYQVVKDESYNLFKINNLFNWSIILLNIKSVLKCLKKHKIMNTTIKADYLTQWDGKKIQQSKVLTWLGLASLIDPTEQVQRQILGFIDRLKVSVIKSKIQRNEWLARWVIQRMKALKQMRLNNKQKLQKSFQMQENLRNTKQWDVQIYIPSFSVDIFKRNTTQYMDWFQNQYHCLWEHSTVPLVLVLPTLNQSLLTLFQNKLPMGRPATIITPQIYSVFPPNLSLAAQVYFSYETLCKIKKAVGSKKAVIIGGPYSEGQYERLISEYLKAPLLRSVRSKSQFDQQKILFKKSNIKVQQYCLIGPQTSSQQLFQLFAELLSGYDVQKSWVLKIKGQFRGRGIATLKINPNKSMKEVNRQGKTKKQIIIQTLRSILRLKLKVNFQNSVYVVDDFLTMFRKQGGIIQQFIQTTASYQLCFYKAKKCQIHSIFKTFGTNFNNKLWLSVYHETMLDQTIQKLMTAIDQEDKYIGHLSVTIFKTSGGYVGNDIKFGQTPAAGSAIFSELLQEPKPSASESFSLTQRPTKRLQIDSVDRGLWMNKMSCLFIPAFPFTDIEEQSKAKLVQQLVQNSWNDRHLKLGSPLKVFLSLGLDFSGLLLGRDLKRLKRQAGEIVRDLSQKSSLLREYRGKEMVRDVFEFGEIIRAISQIKTDQ